MPRPIWVLFTSDEEIGSPTSRGLIERLALECAYVLVLEPALADGGLKTSRKGVGRFQLEVEGRPPTRESPRKTAAAPSSSSPTRF